MAKNFSQGKPRTGRSFGNKGGSNKPRSGGRDFGDSRSSSSGSRFGGNRYGGRDFAGSRGGSRVGPRREPFKDMIEVVCDACGKNCEVPFRPTAGKPVYCSRCFETRGGDSRSSSNRDTRGGQSRDSKPADKIQLEQINKKLDKIIKFLELD